MGLLAGNPVFAKEMRSRVRSRKQPRSTRVASLCVVGLVLLLLYFYGVRWILSGSSGSGESAYLFFTGFVLLTMTLLVSPPLAAGAITQEREQQTWNALLLSRLTAAEIVTGKFVAALLPALVLQLLFAPLNLLAAVVGSIPGLVYGVSNLLLFATTLFLIAMSLFCSWAVKRTFMATAASFSVVAFLVVGTYILYGLWTVGNPGSATRDEAFPPLWLNPYRAMSFVLERDGHSMAIGLIYIVFCALMTVFLLYVVTRRLARGPKELEQ
jgi:ABC-type transport system involved in multi-copper enzyme maturation permease subunit